MRSREVTATRLTQSAFECEHPMGTHSQVSVLDNLLLVRCTLTRLNQLAEADAVDEADDLFFEREFVRDGHRRSMLVGSVARDYLIFDKLPVRNAFRFAEFRKGIEIRLDDVAHIVKKAREYHVPLVDFARERARNYLSDSCDTQLVQLQCRHEPICRVCFLHCLHGITRHPSKGAPCRLPLAKRCACLQQGVRR